MDFSYRFSPLCSTSEIQTAYQLWSERSAKSGYPSGNSAHEERLMLWSAFYGQRLNLPAPLAEQDPKTWGLFDWRFYAQAPTLELAKAFFEALKGYEAWMQRFLSILHNNQFLAAGFIEQALAWAYVWRRPDMTRKALRFYLQEGDLNTFWRTECLVYLGLLDLTYTRYEPKALAYILRAVEESPRHYLALTSLAHVHLKEGDFKQAEWILTKATELAPHRYEAVYLQIYSACLQLNFQQAGQLLNVLLDLYPNSFTLQWLKGFWLNQQNQAEAACKHWLNTTMPLAQSKSEQADVLFNIGKTYLYTQSDPQTALKFFEEAIRLSPDSPYIFEYLTPWFERNLQESGSWLYLYDLALKACPWDIERRLNLAQFCAQHLGLPKRSRELLLEVLQLDPHHEETLDWLDRVDLDIADQEAQDFLNYGREKPEPPLSAVIPKQISDEPLD